MNTASTIPIESFTIAEKLLLMERLWEDLSRRPADVPDPEWHGQVLDSRLATPSAKTRLPIDAAIEDVKDRLNARRTQG